jgi:hypothetical protein
MQIRILTTSLILLSVSVSAACGSDESNESGSAQQASTAGARAPSRPVASTTTTVTPQLPEPPMVQCGAVMCESPGAIAAFISMPCCLDETSGTCGVMPFGGGACAKPPESDPRCPELDVMGIKVASCCTAQDQCGLDTSMLGMMGCTALEEVSAQIPAMGFITFPMPRACSGGAPSSTDADAGI